MKLQHIKLVTVFVPAGFLGLVAYLILFHLADSFRTVPGFLSLLAGIVIAAVVFSTFAFRVIERLEAQVNEQNRHLLALARIAGVTTECVELDELLNAALDQVLEVTGSSAGAVCLLDVDAAELVAACSRGFSDEIVARIQRQKLDSDPVGRQAVTSGKPVIIDRNWANPETMKQMRREGLTAAASVPMKAEQEVGGVLVVASSDKPGYSRAEVELLVNVSTQLGLAVRNSLLLARTQQRNQELAALLAVGRATSLSLNLDALLDQALEAIVSETPAAAAEVWLINSHGKLELVKQHGVELPRDAGRACLALGEGLPGRVAETGCHVVVDDLDREAAGLCETVREAGFKSYSAFPIRQHGETLGVLGVASKEPASLSSLSLVRLLEGISERLAIGIDNARLHGRVLDVAVLEERERIARELHDGLAQVLGYINTQTLAVRKLLGSGRTEEAERQLQSMEDAARAVYGDVREAILGLSTSLPVPGGLVSSLRVYVEQFSRMTGVPVEIQALSEFVTEGLPAPAEIQVMRILQEALSNCRKHASAAKVDIRFSEAHGALLVDIEDDGQGFDVSQPNRAGWPQFGLQSMRERAKAIGGELAVRSRPGEGTCVTVQVPLTAASQEASVARTAG